jgi:uncharacterized protein (TIGR00369 family)
MNAQDRETILKRQRTMIELFDKAPIKRTYGMELSYDEEGRAVFDMPYNPRLDHFLGGIHGAVIATLLDNAGWFTASTYYDTWVATVEFQCRLLSPVEKVDLQSRGWMRKIGKRFAIGEMEVKTRDGLLVAIGSGTFAVTTAPLADRITPREGL